MYYMVTKIDRTYKTCGSRIDEEDCHGKREYIQQIDVLQCGYPRGVLLCVEEQADGQVEKKELHDTKSQRAEQIG